MGINLKGCINLKGRIFLKGSMFGGIDVNLGRNVLGYASLGDSI